ncbi:LamG-like jellyroll fold domain-containing protein [Haloferula sp. BvORR071]|uniref:LamG-like jellyroll fold domain-containing protein n=1 Tax=Haloferula sp. BvORR071 TaxID=1396141 RepID=UPI00054E1792|nr:LamG-like jellyroll fold domain-containing protein [Haloferula sp. BvORR071]
MKTQRCLIYFCTGIGVSHLSSLHAATAPLTGGDAGQGLTVTAQYLKGVNLGVGTARTVQGATFTGAPAAGFTVTGLGGFTGNFTGNLNFGAGETSANDTAMTELARTLFFGGGGMDVAITGLTAGTSYQLNLIQSVTTSFGPREQAILLNGTWQENVMLTQGNNAKITTLVATANGSGQIALGLRPSGSYGGTGPQDGAVLSGIAVTTIANPDSDNDQLLDVWEYGYFPGDLTKLSGSGDFDGDGATDKQEYDASTNPTNPDSDGDTLTDGTEINRKVAGVAAPTNPNSKDSDKDGLLDNEETGTGTFVSATNTGSNPLSDDSDGDTFKDQIEVLLGSDPNNAASVPTGHAASPLVSLDASALPLGPLTTWTNTGLLTRSFNAVSETPPTVTTLQGVKGVTLDGQAASLVGPAAPSILTGGSSRTVEAWIYNPAAATEETIVSWGHRDGPDGTHSSFIHGTNATFGAFGGWGAAADVGWGTVPPKTGRWTHVAYTYDSTGKAFKVYNDGVLAAEETNTLNTWATDLAGNPLPIRIGAQNGPTGVLVAPAASMTIAKLVVHDRALSASELKNNDSDLDGLPDFYEVFYGLNPASNADAALDPDGDGVSSLIEYRLGTNPVWANPDTDSDGLFDEWEIANFRDITANPAETDAVILAKYSGTSDTDSDGFSNREEFLGGSNPNDANSLPTDQDADSMADAWEIQHFGSTAAGPFDDSDGDGSFNIDEFLGNTPNPADWATDASDPKDAHSQPDTDGNHIGDGWEFTYFTGPGTADPLGNPDGDGLNNQVEYANLTNPNEADTDGDGLNDDIEVNRKVNGVSAPTNPRSKDSDNDTLSDLVETGTGIYVSRANTGTDPLAVDSDGDTYADALEVARGSNPNSASSTPPAYGLMARWSMNETSGTTVPATPDATSNGTFANFQNQPVTMAWDGSKGIGGALACTANTDRVEIPALNLSYGFTVMGWIKPGTEAQATWARLITSRFQDGFFLGRDGGTNNWKFIVNNNFNLAGGTIVADTWQHVCGTFDGTTARLYVNGVEVGSQPMITPSAPLLPIYFGAEGGVDRGFTGLMDEFKIYSGALPASEVSNIHSQESALIGNAPSYDAWAASYGLDPQTPAGSRTGDADHDGTINEVEFALNLSPVDGKSGFDAKISGSAATGITLTWPSQPGLSFQVRSGSNLNSFPTLEATVPAAAAPAVTTSWSSGPFSSGAKFFRIEFTP